MSFDYSSAPRRQQPPQLCSHRPEPGSPRPEGTLAAILCPTMCHSPSCLPAAPLSWLPVPAQRGAARIPGMSPHRPTCTGDMCGLLGEILALLRSWRHPLPRTEPGAGFDASEAH